MDYQDKVSETKTALERLEKEMRLVYSFVPGSYSHSALVAFYNLQKHMMNVVEETEQLS